MKILFLACIFIVPILAKYDFQLQKKNVCFGAKGNKFGTFRVKHLGMLRGIKLVHKRGWVNCALGKGGRSNWGCGKTTIGVVVTTESNKILFPENVKQGGWYELKGFTSRSENLVLINHKHAPEVKAGQKLRIWYGEDLKNFWEIDNSGRVCADVYVDIMRPLTGGGIAVKPVIKPRPIPMVPISKKYPQVWELQEKKVCLKGKGRDFGSFKIQKAGMLNAIKLVFDPKFVACACKHLKIQKCDASKIRAVITDKSDAVYFPGFQGKKYVYKNEAYKAGPYALVLDDPTRPNFLVETDKPMKVFLGEKKIHGCGTPCPDVWAHIRDKEHHRAKANLGHLRPVLLHRPRPPTNQGGSKPPLKHKPAIQPPPVKPVTAVKPAIQPPPVKPVTAVKPAIQPPPVKPAHVLRCHGHDHGCCTDKTPCHIGEGDCDKDSHCKGNLVCGHDNCPWGDNDDCCMESPASHLRCHGHDNGCCTVETPCKEGEGDCDSNHHCMGDLICGHDNCPWGDNDDCCTKPPDPSLRCKGHDHGCCTTQKPCKLGDGDCDSDADCQGQLICGHNNCPWGDNDDCCMKPPPKSPLRCHGQDHGCCTDKTPCFKGEGDCDADSDCAGYLICGHNNCPWGDKDDCCAMPDKPPTPQTLRCKGKGRGCCSPGKPCFENDGDCNKDADCAGSMVCGDNNCKWGGKDDCCVVPTTKPKKLRCDGHDHGCCTHDKPCVTGEGDCDSDGDCAGTLKCGHNNCPWGDNDDCCH